MEAIESNKTHTSMIANNNGPKSIAPNYQKTLKIPNSCLNQRPPTQQQNQKLINPQGNCKFWIKFGYKYIVAQINHIKLLLYKGGYKKLTYATIKNVFMRVWSFQVPPSIESFGDPNSMSSTLTCKNQNLTKAQFVMKAINFLKRWKCPQWGNTP